MAAEFTISNYGEKKFSSFSQNNVTSIYNNNNKYQIAKTFLKCICMMHSS